MDIVVLVVIVLGAAAVFLRPPLRPAPRVPDRVPEEWTRAWRDDELA